MNTLTSRLLLLAIIVLLGLLGILRSNEGFVNPPPRNPTPPRNNTPAPNPAQLAMNAVLDVTNMGITDAQRGKLGAVIGYLKGQGAHMTTGGGGL